MTRLPLIAALLLSACAVPDDWCYTHRKGVTDCIERAKTDPTIECECQAPEASVRAETRAAPPTITDPVDPIDPPDEPLREPPGEGKDRPGYREWVDAGRPKP